MSTSVFGTPNNGALGHLDGGAIGTFANARSTKSDGFLRRRIKFAERVDGGREGRRWLSIFSAIVFALGVVADVGRVSKCRRDCRLARRGHRR